MLLDFFRRFIQKPNCNKYQNEITYLNDRVETLTKLIGQSIVPIEITAKIAGRVKPYLFVNCVVGDGEYETFTLSDWKVILLKIHTQIKDQCIYTPEIFDCDDFALLFSSIMTYSAYKSNMKIQPAFGIAWSKLHAFNIFIANNEVYIYEPQNNQVMTLAEANKEAMYKVTKIWFMS